MRSRVKVRWETHEVLSRRVTFTLDPAKRQRHDRRVTFNLSFLKITLIIIRRMDYRGAGLEAGRPLRRLCGGLIRGDDNLN